jgi:hypothetical protein
MERRDENGEKGRELREFRKEREGREGSEGREGTRMERIERRDENREKAEKREKREKRVKGEKGVSTCLYSYVAGNCPQCRNNMYIHCTARASKMATDAIKLGLGGGGESGGEIPFPGLDISEIFRDFPGSRIFPFPSQEFRTLPGPGTLLPAGEGKNPLQGVKKIFRSQEWVFPGPGVKNSENIMEFDRDFLQCIYSTE